MRCFGRTFVYCLQVHGHSAHHIQGVEVCPGNRVIMYGCGDFIDDYALDRDYRNDLSALWLLELAETAPYKPLTLKIMPTRVANFAVQALPHHDPDYTLVRPHSDVAVHF